MASESPSHENSIGLFLSGDVMLGRGIDQILPHPGDPLLHEHYMKSARGYVEIAEEASGPISSPVDLHYVWGDALAELKRVAPDLRIINLETAITISDEAWPHKGIHYRMHPDNAPVISAAGIDCCVLGNNHVLDWGYAGLHETLATLRQAGIATAGVGRSLNEAAAPAIFDLGEKGRVLVFSVASRSSGVPVDWAATADRAGVNYIDDFSTKTVTAIADRVRAGKRAGDVAVLSIHWGGNWGYEVSAAERKFAHRLIDEALVDVIHGHSSHHPKGLEVHAGKPIIYGCGDFLNDYEGISGHEAYRGELALMYFLSIEPKNGQLRRLTMSPMRIHRFRLNRASAEDARWLAATLDRESGRFGAGVSLQDHLSLELRWGSAVSE